jgi:hypothetical protein
MRKGPEDAVAVDSEPISTSCPRGDVAQAHLDSGDLGASRRLIGFRDFRTCGVHSACLCERLSLVGSIELDD